MKRNFIFFLCCILCSTIVFGQANTSTTAFSGCPGVYVAGLKNGTNCTATPYTLSTVNLNGGIVSNLFTLPSSNLEINGIGISRIDNRGYALLFDRTAITTSPFCTYSNVRLIRFGANGVYESLGTITPPARGIVLTPLGAIDGSGNYIFSAADSFGVLYAGKISNLGTLSTGTGSISATYTPISTLCNAVYADWAVNPKNNNLLYTYGIYNDRVNGGTTTVQKPTGTLMKVDLTAGTVTCIGVPTTNPSYFTDTALDNFAGVMFGADGALYGVNVKDRALYRIDTATGALSNVGTLGGGSGQLRGDLGSCASFADPVTPTPTPFSCSPTAPTYVIGFKNGTNCTVAPYNVYTMSLNGTISPTPLFTTPDTIEVNGIGINSADNRGYALWFRRDNNTTPSTCINDTVKLIRFGANGAPQLLGYIPQPAGYTLNTALGTIGPDGAYYYGAIINGQLSVGKITNVAGLAAGTGALTATYRTVVNACSGRIFADWAFKPGTNILYTYGISANANNQATGIVMTIDLSATTVNVVLNCQSATETTGTFTDLAQDNIGGIMFGTDGLMYGVNVNTRRYYRINSTTGAITLVSTIPANGAGTPTTSPMRTDMGSCVTSGTPPLTPFTCSGTSPSYVIGFKNGTNCTVAPYNLYTTNEAGTLAAAPLFSTPDTIEINGIGLSAADNYGYSLWFRRDNNTTPNTCINDTIKFIRFGANGTIQMLGYIPQPAGYTINAALGTLGTNGTYYFGAVINGQLAIGRIYNTQLLTPGTSPLAVTYQTVAYNCGGRIFADWAFNTLCPNDKPGQTAVLDTSILYTYGIYINANNQVTGGVVTINIANTPNAILDCAPALQQNTTEFMNAAQDNFGGIMFGTQKNIMFGVNVSTRKLYKIDITSGAITYVSTYAADGSGSTTSSPMRLDIASCVSPTNCILPLGFEKPAVTSLGECKAELSWTVSGVEPGDVFLVEKSYDGTNFTTLTTVKATTTGSNSYSITDDKTGITNYYRIKGVSKSGEVKYSPIVRFLSSCGGKNNVTLFQNLLSSTNAVSGEVSLYKSQTVTASVYNSIGVRVFTKTTTATAGVSRFSYDIPSLSKGVYMLQTVIGQERFTEKFIVQ